VCACVCISYMSACVCAVCVLRVSTLRGCKLHVCVCVCVCKKVWRVEGNALIEGGQE